MFPPHTAQSPSDPAPCYPFNCLNPAFVRAIEGQFSKGCDIFQAEFADMLTLGPLMAGRVPSLFVHHQLHYVYARRFLEAHRANSANARYLTERMIREESTYLSTFNSVIVFSDVDCQELNTFCPDLEVHVSPFPSPEDPITDVLPFKHAVEHFVFVACEGHGPNRDGLRWFMRDVWPTIKNRLPAASMEVIGKWSPAGQMGIPNYGDIRFLGFVPELGKALHKKVMIVPVWIGSGIRTKILAAWSASCPVVTTTIGAEGLPGQSGEHFIIADNAPAFATACIELAQNTDKLTRIAASGLDLVQKHYSLEAVRKTRLDIYEQLLAAPRREVTPLFRAEGGASLGHTRTKRNGQAIHNVR